jgi:hypothetical protein
MLHYVQVSAVASLVKRVAVHGITVLSLISVMHSLLQRSCVHLQHVGCFSAQQLRLLLSGMCVSIHAVSTMNA